MKSFLLGKDFAGFGRRVSMLLSLGATLWIWIFFVYAAGWKPTVGREADIGTYYHWILLGYLSVQAFVLVMTSMNTSGVGEVMFDTFTSVVPVFFGGYILMNHWNGHSSLPMEQLRYLKSTEMALVLDLVLDFGIALIAATRRLQTS